MGDWKGKVPQELNPSGGARASILAERVGGVSRGEWAVTAGTCGDFWGSRGAPGPPGTSLCEGEELGGGAELCGGTALVGSAEGLETGFCVGSSGETALPGATALGGGIFIPATALDAVADLAGGTDLCAVKCGGGAKFGGGP
jgi:hypothetical protein